MLYLERIYWQFGSLNAITSPAESTIVNRYFDREGDLDSLVRRAALLASIMSV